MDRRLHRYVLRLRMEADSLIQIQVSKEADTLFCVKCGKQNLEDIRYCPSCGEKILSAKESEYSISPTGSFIEQKKKLKKRVTPILLSLLLTAFAVSQMALGIIGERTTGIVTDYQQRIFVGPGQDNDNTRDATRYEVFYRFTASNGKEYSGSVTKSFPHGIKATVSGSTQSVEVRYLSFMPHINMSEGETNVLPGILLIVLASLLFLIGIKGSVTIGSIHGRRNHHERIK